MKHLFFTVILLALLCSCAHNPEPPLYMSRFHAEKDAFMPNGWRFREDGLFAKPQFFEMKAFGNKYDEFANLFVVKADGSPVLGYYCGYYDVDDDSVIDIVADAAGKGTFSLGVELCDSERNMIGERHQGFNLIPVEDDNAFKTYRYRLFFLANENSKARYVRLLFIVDPSTSLTLRNISLDIKPYEIDRNDSTYIKFQEKERKEGYRK
jgi:hypothetical protein